MVKGNSEANVGQIIRNSRNLTKCQKYKSKKSRFSGKQKKATGKAREKSGFYKGIEKSKIISWNVAGRRPFLTRCAGNGLFDCIFCPPDGGMWVSKKHPQETVV